MKTPPMRRGRPTSEPEPGVRVPLSLRTTPDLKLQLGSAAEAKGRSLSQEAELRLEQSFRDEGLLGDVLGLAYGPHLAGLLLSIGWAMEDTGRQAAFGAEPTIEAADNWFDDPYAFDQAARAAATILLAARPRGDPSVPVFDNNRITEIYRGIGQGTGNGIIDALKGRHASLREKDRAEPIRSLLGPTTKRLKRPKGEVQITEGN